VKTQKNAVLSVSADQTHLTEEIGNSLLRYDKNVAIRCAITLRHFEFPGSFDFSIVLPHMPTLQGILRSKVKV
jgi:hypothetical protein